MFEGWSDEKLDQYDIDPETYDHTNILSRPPILLANYCKQRTPYLTVIHLWDKLSDYLLSSRHDTLCIGIGEMGMEDSTSGESPNKGERRRKNEDPPVGLNDAFNSVINLCNESVGFRNKPESNEDLKIENQSLSSLIALIEQHKSHLAFLKENDMCDDDRKGEIMNEIENIFIIINSRSKTGKNKKRDRDTRNSDKNTV